MACGQNNAIGVWASVNSSGGVPDADLVFSTFNGTAWSIPNKATSGAQYHMHSLVVLVDQHNGVFKL